MICGQASVPYVPLLEVNHPFYGIVRTASLHAVVDHAVCGVPRAISAAQSWGYPSSLSLISHIQETLFTQRDLKYPPPMDASSRPDNDTTKSPSPPDVMSNVSQNKTKLTDSGSYQATSGPTRPSRTAIAKKTLSNERLDSAAGASPGATSSRPSRTGEVRPADDRSTAVPAAVSRDLQTTARRRDINEFDVELDAQPRAGQVGPVLVWYFCL